MQQVGVVGCGLMGAGIAEVCARAGLSVVVVESSDKAARVGRDRIETSLRRAESRGKVGELRPRSGLDTSVGRPGRSR